MPEPKHRKWCVTINNWTDQDLQAFRKEAENCEYAVVGKEVGREGTPHLQCFLYYKNARSFASVKKALPNAHLEIAKGTVAHNQHYCEKDGDFEAFGTAPKQGKRSDLDEIRDILHDTSSMAKVVEVASSYQAAKMGEMILKYNEQPRKYGARRVVWHWGDTGTGKTYNVYEQHPEVFCPVNFKWWDGYDGHKVILLDDIRGDYCKFHEILMLTGERPFRVESKGGSRQAVYDTIYITSPFHPSQLWQTIEDKSQLLDRITEIVHFEGRSKRHKSGDTEVEGNTNLDFGGVDGSV